MRSVSVLVLFLFLCGFLLFGFTNSFLQGDLVKARAEYTATPSYDRIDEVKKHCAFVLSSATALKPEDNRVYTIKEDIFFVNGDWRQDAGKAPIIPYVDRESYRSNSSDVQKPLNLVSFWVTDVDHASRSKKSISVNGFLVMGITLDSFGDRPYEGSPQFQMWPGHTQLSIAFQGVYTESKKNGGESVMCLLGSTMLPSRESESSDPWEWVKDSNYNQPPLLQDDQILLVLHYPISFTLTNRVIKGEMRSLNSKSNLKYFDGVHILSQLSKLSNYEFGSEKFVSKACEPYPYEDSVANGGIDIYKGTGFCEILGQITGEGAGPFTIVPHWRCNGTDDFCSKLGPFVSDKEIKATDGSFKGVELSMQNVKCEQMPAQGNVSSARVAAVFRAVPPVENQYIMAMRSGPSNMTVAAEGIWKSSSGQLCMVGCLGLVDTDGSSCNSRVCLYIPMSFSIKQRSIIIGSFSSTSKINASYFPLSFEKLVRPTELWNYFRNSRPYYSYSKIEKAAIILEKNQPFSFQAVFKKSLLQFPKLEDTEAYITSLSLLAEDLTLHTSAFPDPFSGSQPTRTDFQMEILSLGPLFGRYWSSHNISSADGETPYHGKAEYTEKQLLMNVSAQIALNGDAYGNFSVLFLEGLYDLHVGKMYLVGCRDVRASWNILFDSMDLEAGLDCLIEVVVSYPPTTSRWLVNPTARISISSQRNGDDPLHFSTVRLQTLPIMYRRQREDILSRRGVEGILRILTLSFAIACILSQLFYIKQDADSVPFISLVMLGVQALGYSLPLITGAEALFKRMSSESYETSSYDLEKNQWVHVIDYTVKLLVMVSFLLTLRLCQKVWKSRIRLLARTPHEPHRVPNDKRVFLAILTIHVTGYVIVLIIHSFKTSRKPFRMEKYIDSAGNSRTLQEWETELEEYVGLVQDFFLLPQVIGNIMWQIDCKPLKELYFMGITFVRLLPHVYDYIRAPIPNPYFADEYEFVNPNVDFYSKFGDIAIPTTAILLAVAVYIQQRWNYEKLSQSLTIGQRRLLPMSSRMYQRLPSKSSEAELVSGVNGDAVLDSEHDNEE
ncbi:hypothetical protein P3X46_001328 [Hevea brasiliensis]|uniref:RING-type E3 ubiquitin transferase n=1 Tax=Hevea brasiliensis TaxID=3981 RepID=A0ABQ9NC66_HEVBR|nr:uncharacterized protein LOC110634158 [Hevea brasiliensis]KAJ9190096.1 hypothetical protein P3X46_001328 [Hevea brasiliensis]